MVFEVSNATNNILNACSSATVGYVDQHVVIASDVT